MFIAAIVVTVLLAALVAESARGKFVRNAISLRISETTGWPVDRLWILALLEIAGGLGLLGGLFWWPLGAAAAVGLVLYFVGGVLAHRRAQDPGWQPAAAMAGVSAAVLALRLLSA